MEVEPRSQSTLYSYAFETDPVPVRVVKSYLKRSRVYASYLVETLLIGRWSDLRESSCSANYKDPDAGNRLAALIGDSPLNGAESRARWGGGPVGATGYHDKDQDC